MRLNGRLSIFAVVVALTLGAKGLAQSECGTVLRPEEAVLAWALELAGAYRLPERVGRSVLKGVPLALHVVRADDGSGGISQDQLDQALEDANAAFEEVGIVFCEPYVIDYIDMDDFYYDIDTLDEINALRTFFVLPKAVNIYFTENLATESGSICGISSFTFSDVQGIIMKNSCTGTASNPSSFPHELGHYFDLYHTHETASGVECADGSNCDSAGDLLCDTPADPKLTSGTVTDYPGCQYTGGEMGPCSGDIPYDPDTRNMMSYSRKQCRDDFTPDQNDKALATLLNLRPELYEFRVPQDWAKIQAAVDFSCNGAEIIVGEGEYNEKVRTNGKDLTIRSTQGSDETTINPEGEGRAVNCQAEGATKSLVLEGFTVTGGEVAGAGGGIRAIQYDLTVADCVFHDNTAGSSGGAIDTTGGSATITDCTFTGNGASEHGGGIALDGGASTVSGCTFTGNAAMAGGAMYVYSETVAVSDSYFCANVPDHIDREPDGNWTDGGGNVFCPPCVGDLDGDGLVGVTDFLNLLAAWGSCPGPPTPCIADLDGDGTVGVLDFLIVLANWGPCPE